MSFGGPIDSMINAHKSNLRLLRGRKRLKEIEAQHKSKQITPVNIPSGLPQGVEDFQHQKFKKRIKHFRREERYRHLLIVVITVILLLIILLWIASQDFSEVIDTIS